MGVHQHDELVVVQAGAVAGEVFADFSPQVETQAAGVGQAPVLGGELAAPRRQPGDA